MYFKNSMKKMLVNVNALQLMMMMILKVQTLGAQEQLEQGLELEGLEIKGLELEGQKLGAKEHLEQEGLELEGLEPKGLELEVQKLGAQELLEHERTDTQRTETDDFVTRTEDTRIEGRIHKLKLIPQLISSPDAEQGEGERKGKALAAGLVLDKGLGLNEPEPGQVLEEPGQALEGRTLAQQQLASYKD